MEYFNADDLTIRRGQIADWLCCQTECVVNGVLYGEPMSAKDLMDLELVVAYAEAIACYQPVTSEDEDGVINCLTEEQAEKIFKNVSTITNIQWHGKGITYRDRPTASDEHGQIGAFTLTEGVVSHTKKDV